MGNTTTGEFLRWEAADSTGITGSLDVAMLAWCSTDGTNRDIAGDDDFEIQDQNSVVLLKKRAEAVGDGIDPIVFPPGSLILDGIKVTKLDGGEFFLWLYGYRPS